MHNPRIIPEFQSLIPPLSPEEYTQLEQNILTHGCRDPIALWRGIIIDGHNRHEICTKHGIPYETIKLPFPTQEAAKVWILENQLGRRNITDAMRIELAARMLEYTGQKIYERTYVRQHIASAAGLSEQTVRHYMQIKAHGDPELLECVMSGRLKIGTARRQIEVTTTTKESCPVTIPPEEQEFYYTRGMLGNIRLIVNIYEFLAGHLEYRRELPGEVLKRLGLQLKKVIAKVSYYSG